MLTKKEIMRILKMNNKLDKIKKVAEKTDHSKNTIKKYIKKPKRIKVEHYWKTRANPFEDVWEEVKNLKLTNPSLQAKTIFQYLQEKYPNKFKESQLRSLQRHIKILKAFEGKNKEVMFEQIHTPGDLASIDFTNMNELDITINHQHFKHILFHLVLTFSNWEWARICYTENFESLRSGLKESLIRLGGVPNVILSDNLTSAVHNDKEKNFKPKYLDLIKSFGLKGRTIQPGCSNENGDVEQRHYRLKNAIDQTLMLRGGRNFSTIDKYKDFLENLLIKLNKTRTTSYEEELKKLKPLPQNLIADYTLQICRVTKYCTIRVCNNSYSLPSSFIGENVDVHIYDNKIEVWFSGKKVLATNRLCGNKKFLIDYRHIINSLIKKPGAFNQYKYLDALFPSSTFRMIYDHLLKTNPLQAVKIYLKILSLCCSNGENIVERSLKNLIKKDTEIISETLQKEIENELKVPSDNKIITIKIPPLSEYDKLINSGA